MSEMTATDAREHFSEALAAGRAALDEDAPSIPWAVVKADLGLA